MGRNVVRNGNEATRSGPTDVEAHTSGTSTFTQCSPTHSSFSLVIVKASKVISSSRLKRILHEKIQHIIVREVLETWRLTRAMSANVTEVLVKQS